MAAIMINFDSSGFATQHVVEEPTVSRLQVLARRAADALAEGPLRAVPMQQPADRLRCEVLLRSTFGG